MIAITHAVSPNIGQCELTHRRREPIDVDRAQRQHWAYCEALRRHGCRVIELRINETLPDSVFVEDTAVVLDEMAIICRPGAPSRRKETSAVAEVLGRFRSLFHIRPPGTLEGGDVLRIGKTLYVGRSSRTNDSGIRQLESLVEPYGYTVQEVQVRGCLHLKTAVTALDENTVVAYPPWIDMGPFSRFRIVAVSHGEADAANTLRLEDTIIVARGFPETEQKIREAGYRVETVDISELRKAEAGLTCSSLIFH